MKFSFNLKRLLILILISGLSILGAVFYLLNSSLVAVTNKANDIDLVNSEESISITLHNAIKKNNSLTSDNSQWQVAYDQTKGALDQKWLYETWGSSTELPDTYDAAIILDQNKKVIWGYLKGHDILNEKTNIKNKLLEDIDNSINGLPSNNHIIGGFTEFDGQTAIISYSRINPMDFSSIENDKSKRFLVLINIIEQSNLIEFSQNLKLDGMRITNDENTSPKYVINDLKNKKIGVFTWDARKPGLEAAKVAKPKIMQSLLLIGLIITGFLGFIIYCFRKIGQSEENAINASMTDSLSGLPNRRALSEAVLEIQNSKSKTKPKISIGFIDLDGFKDVNDTYGHEIGDKLISLLSDKFKSMLPANTLLVRLGGDEFAYLFQGNNSERTALRYADEIIEYLSTNIYIGGRPIKVGASIGIATTNMSKCDVSEIFRRADTAMYHAKTNHKGTVIVYNESLDANRNYRKSIANGIKLGLEKQEFDVVYQPIINAKTHKINGVEALVRWPRRPEGALGPDEFIDIAEESGTIHQLGLYVIEKACNDWLDNSDVRLSINVSPAQFRDPDFETKVKAILEATGFPPERLEIELTEGYLIDHPERAKQAIGAFKDYGIMVSLDDFGTGYTSIAYLRSYGFDKIKIDKSLSERIEDDHASAILVQGVIFIANGLSMQVTAEGVESLNQAKLLEVAGCNLLQGYLFGKPQEKESIVSKYCEGPKVIQFPKKKKA